MAATMVPYLVGYGMSNGRVFMWLGANLDDSCVYLSWMKQAADGSLRALNLFTTDPQHGMAPNPLFWTLGRTASFLHLPLIAAYHASRLLCGWGLLLAVWQLICLLIARRPARRLAFLFVCFSSGLGWLPWWWSSASPPPIDTWQPEAITFLSLYLSPLFCFSMLLQVAMICLLLMGERAKAVKYSAAAGLCGFVLGMAHTYDVITMSAVWLGYIVVTSAVELRRGSRLNAIAGSWLRAAVAGLVTLPAVLYVAYQLRTEIVFRERADVATLSPQLAWIFVGYGITLLLAIAGIFVVAREARRSSVEEPPASKFFLGRDSAVLLVVWAAVNLAVAYVPVSFQRKLLQGEHFPISLLAGVGAAWLSNRLLPAARNRFALWAAIVTIALAPTNVLFMLRDVNNFARNESKTGLHRAYLQPGELSALDWVRANSAPGTAVQPLPWIKTVTVDGRTQLASTDAALMCFAPGLIDRPVYCGHWGETPKFRDKLGELAAFTSASPRWTDEMRAAFIRSTGVRYVVFSQKRFSDATLQGTANADALIPRFRGNLPLPTYLRLRYSNADADVYEVLP
jgi:hypothetical protein